MASRGEDGAIGSTNSTSCKRRQRFNRSKSGCLTCRRRKVKCDEQRPICARCHSEHRECNYPEQQTKSPGRPLSVHRGASWSSDEGDAAATSSSASRPDAISGRAIASHQYVALDNLQGIGAAISEPTQYDDWLAFLFGTSTRDTPNTELDSSISEWMSNSIFLPELSTSEPFIAPSTSLRSLRPIPSRNGSKDSFLLRFSSEQQRRMADNTLQQRLRELCTSDVQLEAVSQCECGSSQLS
jgi:hypothetical protein